MACSLHPPRPSDTRSLAASACTFSILKSPPVPTAVTSPPGGGGCLPWFKSSSQPCVCLGLSTLIPAPVPWSLPSWVVSDTRRAQPVSPSGWSFTLVQRLGHQVFPHEHSCFSPFCWGCRHVRLRRFTRSGGACDRPGPWSNTLPCAFP